MPSWTIRGDVWDTREYPLRLCQRTDRDTTLTTKRKVLQIISNQMTEKEKVDYIHQRLENCTPEEKPYLVSLLNYVQWDIIPTLQKLNNQTS